MHKLQRKGAEKKKAGKKEGIKFYLTQETDSEGKKSNVMEKIERQKELLKIQFVTSVRNTENTRIKKITNKSFFTL